MASSITMPFETCPQAMLETWDSVSALSSGCLPGVMRGRALAQGIAVETELAAEFDTYDQAVLINSLSCRPIAFHNGQPMAATTDAMELWQSLLD